MEELRDARDSLVEHEGAGDVEGGLHDLGDISLHNDGARIAQPPKGVVDDPLDVCIELSLVKR